ncbi:hypothetical protein CC53_gp024 [Rhizobium phage vB_RleS_L338C]|uniref:hypothetical protein n=1 Tax=Rhizobium phage vB_RleS_L338C TaxID=1414737 RepID=UPI0003D8C67E|nr:hypothetical protein CC53_gp024 [Rhizobium phage vB_RleS_L338C]AHC30441.1 hypothetical protein L338C_024 [Rhizobium phage vB_RleS_L338C]
MERKQIVTRAEAKAICNILPTKEDRDGIIDALIMVATEQLEKATGRSFTSQSFTDYFDTRQTVDLAYVDSGWSPTMMAPASARAASSSRASTSRRSALMSATTTFVRSATIPWLTRRTTISTQPLAS